MTRHAISGFRFAAISAGIRGDDRADVALAATDEPAAVAGLFTRNLVRAAPVRVAEERVRSGHARAVLVNSGCANACTGAPGIRATEATTQAVAEALGVGPSEVLPASTGVIGQLLPADRIVSHARDLVRDLRSDGANDFATAIMTTDRFPKIAHSRVETRGGAAQVLAIGKGAGMIHPDMGPPQATLLAFLFTDARVSPVELEKALIEANETTFNRSSVDGDTSTNDTLLVLASGASHIQLDAAQLVPAFHEVCDALARSMVADGEGSEHLVELRVAGLGSDGEALAIARTVATSLLVKTALFGKDANWGRLLAAAGRAGVPFDPERAEVRIGDVTVVKDGMTLGIESEAQAGKRMGSPSYSIDLVLGRGPGRARYYMSDLGHGYVDVNAGYRS